MSADAERVSRFDHEARAASALNHPNIVTIHDIGRADGVAYIVMELVDGKTLRALLLPARLRLASCSSSPHRSRTAWPRPTRLASCTAT